jgi:hypothetical protein
MLGAAGGGQGVTGLGRVRGGLQIAGAPPEALPREAGDRAGAEAGRADGAVVLRCRRAGWRGCWGLPGRSASESPSRRRRAGGA